MKLEYSIFGIFSSDTHPDTFAKLESASPQSVSDLGRGSKVFNLRALADSYTFRLVQQILEEAGQRPATPGEARIPNKVFWQECRRVYDQTDLESAPALQLAIDHYSISNQAFDFPDDDGPLEMAGKLMKGSIHFDKIKGDVFLAGIFWNRIIVTDPIRRSIESAGFPDAEFREIKPFVMRNGKRHFHDWSHYGDLVWWELASAKRMPPLAPSNHITGRIVHKPGRELNYFEHAEPGCQGFWRLEEPDDGIRPVELHYKRSEFEAMGDFDVADTLEGGTERQFRRTIVSVPFYKHLVSMGYDMNFIPIRLDDD